MKFNFKEKVKNVDDDLISELISKAEEAMVSPLKKSKVVEVDGEPEDEESQEDSESPEVESEEEDSLDPEDLKKLLEMYKQIKE